jgi:hypothetical protein
MTSCWPVSSTQRCNESLLMKLALAGSKSRRGPSPPTSDHSEQAMDANGNPGGALLNPEPRSGTKRKAPDDLSKLQENKQFKRNGGSTFFSRTLGEIDGSTGPHNCESHEVRNSIPSCSRCC